MPLPNKKTMNLQFHKYGTDKYFAEKRKEFEKEPNLET
jgi:hypothetical protein